MEKVNTTASVNNLLENQDLCDVTLSESYCFICPVTPCHILDSLNLQSHHSENLKSCPHFLQFFSPSLPAVLTMFDQSGLMSILSTVPFCIYSKKNQIYWHRCSKSWELQCSKILSWNENTIITMEDLAVVVTPICSIIL